MRVLRDKHSADPTFPLINKELPRADFDRMLAENPLNDHLLQVVEEISTPEPEQDNTALERATQLINEYCMEVFDQEADFSDLYHVDLAFSSTSDSEHTVEVSADLIDSRLVYQVDGETVVSLQCHDLDDLCEYLANLDFDEMIAYAEEQYNTQREQNRQDAMTEDFENIELFEKPALFSSFRIDRSTVPDGWFCYDVRGSDYDPGRLATLEVKVGVNHAGTILSPEKINFPKGRDHRYIGRNINFLGDSVTSTDSHDVVTEADDGHGNIVETTTTVTETTLYITVSHKTADEMADFYNFTADQRTQLAELLDEEHRSAWSAVLYGIGAGDGEIVTVALSQIGNVGGQPYWSWYGFSSHVEWCACFVSWCANECGYIDAGVIPKFAGCVTGSQWFKDRGLWQGNSYEPRPGDLIFFDWDDPGGYSGPQDGVPDHVGIVEKVENGIVYTVEGNSGDRCREAH